MSVSLPATTEIARRQRQHHRQQPASFDRHRCSHLPTYLPAYLPTYMTDTLRWHTLINSAIHSGPRSLFFTCRPRVLLLRTQFAVALSQPFFPSSAPPRSPAYRSLHLLLHGRFTLSLHRRRTLSRLARLCFCAAFRRRDRIDASSANCISIPVHRVKLHLRLLR